MTSIECSRITDCVTLKTFVSYRVENVKTFEFQWVGDKLINNAFGPENATSLIKAFSLQTRVRKPHTVLEWEVLPETIKVSSCYCGYNCVTTVNKRCCLERIK